MCEYWSDPFWDSFVWSSEEEKETEKMNVTDISDNWYTPPEVFKGLDDMFKGVPKVRYMHLWVKPEYGRITVAYYVQDSMMYMGFSFCLPGDRFCKKEGRERALVRLMKNPVMRAAEPCLFSEYSALETLISFFKTVSNCYYQLDSNIEKLFHVFLYDGKSQENRNFSYWVETWTTLWLIKNGVAV